MSLRWGTPRVLGFSWGVSLRMPRGSSRRPQPVDDGPPLTTRERLGAIALIIVGYLMWCGIVWPIAGGDAALTMLRWGAIALGIAVVGATVLTLLLMALYGALVLLMSPFLLIWAVVQHRRDTR